MKAITFELDVQLPDGESQYITVNYDWKREWRRECSAKSKISDGKNKEYRKRGKLGRILRSFNFKNK